LWSNLLKKNLELLPDLLQDGLQDIVHNVQIEARGCIRHPNYRPMELQSETEQRLQHLPIELQNHYLGLQLRNFLYSVYFSGSWPSNPQLENNNVVSPIEQTVLENNTVGGLNIEFYDHLHRSNAGKGYFDPGWLILREEEDGSLAVQKQDLTLHIQRDLHLQKTEQLASIGSSVAVRLPKNLLTDEFYVAVGNAGPVTQTSKDECSLLNLYFNLNSESLAAAMKSITQQLNALSLPFTFQTICDPTFEDRYSTAILRIAQDRYETVQPILWQFYQTQCAQFRPKVPLFTKLLAPGLSLAEEPRELGQSGETLEKFGMNCCQIVANAVLEAYSSGYHLPQDLMSFILQNFLSKKINLRCPYLKAGSMDTYDILIP
jgi:hypothetical protein